MKICVLGAGAWGTGIAIRLTENAQVTLWARNAEQVRAMRAQRVNSRHLPGVPLPAALQISDDLTAATQAADLLVAAVPTSGLRNLLRQLRQADRALPLIWLCKGFEAGSMKLAHQVVDEEWPADVPRGVLSGPSFALEVARGQPAALTLASRDAEFARRAAAALHTSTLRPYTSTDVVGVEVGGAVKNVIAIAAGVSDGLQFGLNARAALITRGLAEMTRLGVCMGGEPQTFMGLSGVGDLILTCTGDLSRNRQVGLRLARGTSLEVILRELDHVAEGVTSAREVRRLADTLKVDMPITETVCRLLDQTLSPQQAVAALLNRGLKDEWA